MDAIELENAMLVAFEGVKKAETSLRQFHLTDEKGMAGTITPEEWRAAGSARVDSRWEDIPDSEIEKCGCLLAHMQAEDFRYYLPAYMRFSVRHFQEPIRESDILGSTVFSLYPSSKNKALFHYNVAQLSLLTKEQQHIVVEFLRFVAAYADDVQRLDAEKALERYWGRNVGT